MAFLVIISEKTQQLWDKIVDDLNGGGYYGQIIWNHGDEATLSSVLEQEGIEKFMEEWENQSEMAQQGFDEEMHDRTKDDFGGDPKQLIDDNKELEDALQDFLSSLSDDNPEFRQILDKYV